MPSPIPIAPPLIATTYWAVLFGALLLVMSLLQTGENGYSLMEVDASDDRKPLLIHQAIVCAIGMILGAWALFFWKFEKVSRESVNTFALAVGLGAAFTLIIILQQHRYYMGYMYDYSCGKQALVDHVRNVMYGNILLFSMMIVLMVLLLFHGNSQS